jgi:CspA family cold shock protein
MAEGRVKFFHDKKGWGFIERDDTLDVFVHYADILGNGHRTLVKGETVAFDVVDGPKGVKAVNVVRSSTVAPLASEPESRKQTDAALILDLE